MSSASPRFIFGVSHHWLLGSVDLEESRIQDRLNDPRSQYVPLVEVEVHACGQRQCVARLPDLMVPKQTVEFLGVPSQQHEAPQRRWCKFSNKNVLEAFVVLSHYRVSGQLHLPSFTGDTIHALSHQLGRFFPLTQATIEGQEITRVDFPLLIVNKDFVNGLHVGKPSQQASEANGLEYLHSLITASPEEASA